MTYDPNRIEWITAVDEDDRVIGKVDRKVARRDGTIHRIVRVVVYNQSSQILIQQRGPNLDDNPSRWDWSAAGHVDAGEDYLEAALREVREEIGITDAGLTQIAKYYRQEDAPGLTMRRFNAVYRGKTSQIPVADPGEDAQIRWIDWDELAHWATDKPDDFTPNFNVIFKQYQDLLRKSP